MEPVKRTCVGNKAGAFRLEDLPDCLVPDLRMRMGFGPGDTAIQEPGVEFGIALELRPGNEEAPAEHTHLVLHLPFLPARCRRFAGYAWMNGIRL